MPGDVCKNVKVEERQAQQEGTVYGAAGGDIEIPNMGRRRCELRTRGAKRSRPITFQAADIHKRYCQLAGQQVLELTAHWVKEEESRYI